MSIRKSKNPFVKAAERKSFGRNDVERLRSESTESSPRTFSSYIRGDDSSIDGTPRPSSRPVSEEYESSPLSIVIGSNSGEDNTLSSSRIPLTPVKEENELSSPVGKKEYFPDHQADKKIVLSEPIPEKVNSPKTTPMSLKATPTSPKTPLETAGAIRDRTDTTGDVLSTTAEDRVTKTSFNSHNEEDESDDGDIIEVDEAVDVEEKDENETLVMTKENLELLDLQSSPKTAPLGPPKELSMAEKILLQRKQNVRQEQDELLAAEDFEAARQMSADDIYEGEPEWESAMDEDHARYMSEHLALMRKRQNRKAELLERIVSEWDSKPEVCREIHAVLFTNDLVKIKELENKYRNYTLSKDSTLNSVFHTAALAPKLSTFQLLGEGVDKSEFAISLFPYELTTDKRQAIQVLYEAKKVQKTIETVPLLKSGWLNKHREGNLWKRRWCMLYETHLVYYKKDTDMAMQGSISLEGVQFRTIVLETMRGGDLTTFEIISNKSETKKKLSIFLHTKKPNMYFQADTEAEAQEWICLLRAITGNIPILPGFLPSRYSNMEARALVLDLQNEYGESPLHVLARLSKNNQDDSNDEDKIDCLSCIHWLLDQDCNPYSLNADGLTAVQVAEAKHNDDFCQWMKDITRRMVRDSKSTEYPLLHAPLKLPGYSYISLHFQKQRYNSGASSDARLNMFETLKLKISVYNPRLLLTEQIQQLDRPLIWLGRQMFWAGTIHLQMPLEILPDKSFLEFSLIGTPFGKYSTPYESRVNYVIDYATFGSKQVVLDFSNPPTIPGPPPSNTQPAPPSLLSESISKTELTFRIALTKAFI